MDLRKTLNIIYELTLKDIKLKYNNTVFGYFWMVVNPLLMLITLYVVFSFVIKLDLAHYQVFLLLGIIVWNFFSEATLSSIQSIKSSLSLLKKIKIPPYVIVLSSNFSSFISFLVSVVLLLFIMFLFNIDLFTFMRTMSIIYFVLLFIIVISMSLIISTIYLHFKDIKHIWNFLLLIGFWITPIIYPESFIPRIFLRFYMLNPLARIISHLRNTLIYNYMDNIQQIMISVLIVIILFYVSLLVYKRYSKKIYDLL